MRAQAKRSSAANSDGSAARGSVPSCNDNVTRASSLSASGSGASSRRGRLIIAFAIAAFAFLSFASFAQAAKVVVSGFGTGSSGNPPLGGQFSTLGGLATNSTGAGGVSRGTLYAVDTDNNRVQRLSPLGDFERTWGQNVVGRDERQRITIEGSLGSFTLSFGADTARLTISRQTGTQSLQPTSTKVRALLEAMPSIGAGNVEVGGGLSTSNTPQGGSFTIRFLGSLGGTNVPQVSIDGSQISGQPPISASVSTTENGSGGNFAGFEICTIAASCKQGETGQGNAGIQTTAVGSLAVNGGQLNRPQGIAVNQANGHVYITEQDNRRISEFDADGNFRRAWGWDVVLSGRPGDVPGTSEQQRVTLGVATGGKFTLLFGGLATGATGTASTVNGSRELTNVLTTNGTWAVGQVITGTGIPNDTAITGINLDAGTLTLSTAATVTNASGVRMTGHDIPWDASPAQVQAALEKIPTIGSGNVIVTSANPGGGVAGGPYAITFQGPLADTNVAQLTSSGAGLRSVRTVTVATTVGGVLGGFEICTAADDCKSAAAAGADGGRFAGSIGRPVTDSSNNVWIPDPTNLRIQKFDSSGNFVAVYGYNVDARGGSGTLETCTSTAAGFCQAGTAGTALGQFSSATNPSTLNPYINPTKMAVDATGNIYVIDDGNRRVQKFDPTFTSASEFGSAIFPSFTTAGPNQVVATQGGRRLLFAVGNNVTANPPESQLVEIDPADGSVREISLAGSQIAVNIAQGTIVTGSSFSGLAENSTNGDIYAGGGGGSRSILVLSSNQAPAPVPTMSAIATKTDSTATFSGTVDPRGGWVSCKFQYSTDGSVWTDLAEPDCDSIALGSGAQAVSQNATGLLPNTHYFVRLSVSRPLSASSAVNTLPKVFDTDGPAPAISNLGYVELGDTSARIVATIDPRNSATSYVIEYGTTPSLGSSTDPVSIGGGTTPLLVSQVISGLRPNTTYYFKVVASNLTGATSTASKTFTTRTDPLPSAGGRRYEQVSPVDKNYGGVDFGPTVTSVNSPDGEAASFCTGSGLPTDPPGQDAGDCTNYVSRRTPTGWGTRPLSRPLCAPSDSFIDQSYTIPTLNLDYALMAMPYQDFCDIPSLSPDAPRIGVTGKYILYRENTLTNPATFDVVAPLVTDFRFRSGNVPTFSDDGSHIVYPSSERQTSDAFAGATNIFDWHGGTLDLVSRDTGDLPLRTSAVVPPSAVNSVSARGDRIFFQNPVPAGLVGVNCAAADCELYLREGGRRTLWVSEQECSVACSNTVAADVFEWASLDGSRALFRSGARLTDDDTTLDGDVPSSIASDLYLFTRSDNPATDRNLTFLSKDNEPADGNVADVQGVLGISDDASVVYFVANGQIVLGGSTATGPKVYRWRWNGGAPIVDYVATLQTADSLLWNRTDDRPLIRYVTADGRYLLVQTRLQLDPVADRDSDKDIFRWGKEEGWICASCQVPGAPSSGLAKIDGTDLVGTRAIQTNEGLSNAELRIVMSDDGKRIFFTAKDALASGDVNGIVEDLYEWHDGTLNLISGGQDTRDVLMLGASSDGDDVFFITFERLVGWDIDANTDIYDARVGGGFPEPPAEGVPCEGEACRGAGSVAPTVTGAGSRVFVSDGNQQSRRQAKPKPRCPRGKRKVTRNGRTRCVKRGSRNANNNRRAQR